MFDLQPIKIQARYWPTFAKQKAKPVASVSDGMLVPVNAVPRELGNKYLHTSSAYDQLGSTLPNWQICDAGSDRKAVRQGIQAKVTVSTPDDVYEQEADRLAEQIMQMPASSSPTENELPSARIKVQRLSTKGDSTTESVLNFRPNESGGQSLSPWTRQFMEPRFGVDFSYVRLHNDEHSHQAAAQIQARAFTYRNHIWLGKGETEQDKQLMAHELTHVVQQSGTNGIRSGQVNGKPDLSVTAGISMVQRACGETPIRDVVRGRTTHVELGDSGITGTLIRFRVNCDEFLTPEDEAALRSLVGRLPARSRIIIHGFASEEGSPMFNFLLSQARAEKARDILSGLLDPAQIERVVMHGGVPGNRADRRSVVIQTQSPLPPVTKILTIVSWINGAGLPSFSRYDLATAPPTIRVLLAAGMALGCTANTPPPTSLPPSALSAFIASKQYRGLQNYTITYIPSSSARGEFISRQIPGYTAPSSCGPIPPSTFRLGETSPLNYANADISSPNPRANALMKFRVSSLEESDAIAEATSFPGSMLFSRSMLRRVPWVWTQSSLRLEASTGLLHWSVQGSAFPTHTIYLDGVRVDEIRQGPYGVVVSSRFRTADMPRQTMAEEATQASVPIGSQEETVDPGGTASGAG